MLKTTKHLLALALSAAMLLGSPGMLTAFADNGDDLAMAKSLSVQTIGEDPEKNPEDNEITIGQSEEFEKPVENNPLKFSTKSAKNDGDVTQIDENSFRTGEGITITYNFFDYLTGKSLNQTPIFNNTKNFFSSGMKLFPKLNGQILNPSNPESESPYFKIPVPSNSDRTQSYIDENGTEIIYNLSFVESYIIYPDGRTSTPNHYGALDREMLPFFNTPNYSDKLDQVEIVINYTWKHPGDPLLEDTVYNEILPLEHSVSENGQNIIPKSIDNIDTFKVNGKDDIFLDYVARMDMKNLHDEDNVLLWDYLLFFYSNITDTTIVNLNFTFDDNIDLQHSDFSNIILESDMFRYDHYKVDGQNLTIVCYWDSEAANENWPNMNTMITLSGLHLAVKNSWEGNSVKIENSGFVDGLVRTVSINGAERAMRIDGGQREDSLILKIQENTPPIIPTPDPEPQPEPDPEPDRPSRPNRDDDDDWEPLPDAPVKEKAETVEVETEVPEQTETQTPIQQPEKHNPETGDASFAPVSLALAAASLSAAALLARKRK